jgi:hypothetical protein
MEDHTAGTTSDIVSAEIVVDGTVNHPDTQPYPADDGGERPKPTAKVAPTPERPSARCGAFVDDEILPVFEADLDLPRLSAAVRSTVSVEESQ